MHLFMWRRDSGGGNTTSWIVLMCFGGLPDALMTLQPHMYHCLWPENMYPSFHSSLWLIKL